MVLSSLKVRLVLDLCIFPGTITQKNSNSCPKSLQHYGFEAGSPRPPAKGVQSMINMFQQDSACRKQKNVTCLVNITLPPPPARMVPQAGNARTSFIPGTELGWRLVLLFPALGNAAGRQEKPQNTTDELNDEGGIKPQGRRGYKLQKASARSQPPPQP